MSIGVASVNVLIALGESARSYVVHEFESLGTHLIIVLPGRTETTGGAPPVFGETPRDLTLQDAQALMRSANIAAIAPLTIGTAPVSAGTLERETNIFGSTYDLLRVRHLSLAEGSFLPKVAVEQSLPVCVIGQAIKKELFSHSPPLGQWLRINDRRFRVIGVLASEGESIGVDFDEMVVIPVTSAQAIFNTESLFRILIEAKSRDAMLKTIDEVKTIIKLRHEGEDDITIITQDSVVSAFNKILTALTLAVACIGGISLLVAGILVMNVMLVSVSQRTAEIGLLKAIGANRAQIQWLFLAEALLLSIAGAVLGMLLAGILVAVFQSSHQNLPISIPVWGFWSAIIVALLTGLIFGVLPARKAANLDPITALAKR
jgi:putative ABC transport system permease protein